MDKVTRTFDVRKNPELARTAGQVRESKRPLFLRDAEETVAVLVPVGHPKPRRRRAPTEANYQAFLSSAGGWKDVDTDRLLEDVYADRRAGDRPPVDL